MTFEELARLQVKHGLIPAAYGREEEWVAERLRHHHDPVGEFEIERADGRWTRVREEETDNGGLFLTVTDITETKTNERAAREIRHRVRAVIDHLPAGPALKDEHGVHLHANKQVHARYTI